MRTGTSVYAAAGATLQDLVDYSVAGGLAGIHTMTGIPGSVGAAVYGNAGRTDGPFPKASSKFAIWPAAMSARLAEQECEFHYRESIFKRNKDWIVFSVVLALEPGEAADLRRKADEILAIRNRKYPQTMKCAGSIFKNLILAELPDSLKDRIPAKAVIEGKVPSAWFLEQVGAKGMAKGGIRVADYHANLIYNEGHGTAAELREVIRDLKQRVADRFGLVLEEEVQYLGFDS